VSWTEPEFEIRADNTALLVIDMQGDFVDPGAPYESPAAREMVDELNRLMVACRQRSIPVVLTAHNHRADGSDLGAVRHLHPLTADGTALREGTDGVELYAKLDVQPSDHVIRKRRYSAFFSTDLDLLLRNLGVQVLIIAGVATNVCCESTARDAFFRDYQVVFLSDGNGTIDLSDAGWGGFSAEEVQRYTLTNIATFFGEVAPMAEVLERVRAAGQPSA
jgi:ureidoacrylate peracid hydrolase